MLTVLMGNFSEQGRLLVAQITLQSQYQFANRFIRNNPVTSRADSGQYVLPLDILEVYLNV